MAKVPRRPRGAQPGDTDPIGPRRSSRDWDAIREALRNPTPEFLTAFAGIEPDELPKPAELPPMDPEMARRATQALRSIGLNDGLVQPLAPAVAPPAPAQPVASDPETSPANAGTFVHGIGTYTENFDRYLALLPEVERVWLPLGKRASQTSGPKLVAVYRDKYPGSESHLLRRVYAARRKP